MRKALRTVFQGLVALVKSDFAKKLASDLKSLRATWCHIFMALYAWMCIWTVLFHPEAISTALTVTGGVVSIIFTGYVLSRTYERTHKDCAGIPSVIEDASAEENHD